MGLKGALEWMPKEDEKKNHLLHTEVHWGTEAPCTVYEKRPLKDPNTGKNVEGLYIPPTRRTTFRTKSRQGR